ncbi:MAG: ZIP family metal transporter [Treponema sp.]|nr:ZIP family metal transporter [Treponema sp.]
MNLFYGLMIPLLGTTLGSACVFFLKKELNHKIQKLLLGFASGVMVAASIWSLIIPAIDQSEHLGKFAFVPAAIGIALGIIFLLVLDVIIPHLHVHSETQEGPISKLKKNTMLCFAVMLHNIPEGMTVGVVYAALLAEGKGISLAGALALSIGIAIQNFPEGAIISMPLAGSGNGKLKSFLYGMLSGIVEPIAALITILLTAQIMPLLPYFLSFAAGAMLYVVVEELIPEASEGEHSNNGTIGFALGFILMMILDVALG